MVCQPAAVLGWLSGRSLNFLVHMALLHNQIVTACCFASLELQPHLIVHTARSLACL
jgi:hypothetical protein